MCIFVEEANDIIHTRRYNMEFKVSQAALHGPPPLLYAVVPLIQGISHCSAITHLRFKVTYPYFSLEVPAV